MSFYEYWIGEMRTSTLSGAITKKVRDTSENSGRQPVIFWKSNLYAAGQ